MSGLPVAGAVRLSENLSLSANAAGSLTLKVSAKNIGDCRYEISGGYPMPGRSVIGGIEFKL